ncbi:NrfD/PsrC family molybdoenzyme membrane anchor subunit [Natranaeroarchaeum aerophilus]|uniref:Polysulfide reductase NrfD n=1 Tax=Natranaeroarchaeum aerophilus TaxID=2917711 RepID=A0AAE3FLR2_9EURY|nr:NrfD/PsrC family molybdoenzyme membrane anchor subunit [Natranaeroarchaeum aerophilus]MCL9812212.1 polysulfide reductase NrfD [Natranaeroarchaeum aerophilus]
MSGSTGTLSGALEDAGPRYYAWLAAVGLGLLIGLYGVLTTFIQGTVTLGITDQVPWGVLISTYVFFALLSTGICIGVTSLASVFGMEEYEPLVKRGVVLSLITLASGGLVIMAGLGQPLRAIPQMLLSPNPSAPMWWMIVLYGIYGAALVAEFSILEWRPGVSKQVKLGVGLVALIAPILAGGMLGAIFGTAEVRPYYGGMFASVYLLVTAILSGVALIAAITIIERKFSSSTEEAVSTELLTGTLAKYLGVMAGAVLLLTALRYLYGLTATNEALALAHQEMLLSGHGLWTIGLGVVVGLVIPLALMASPKARTMNGVLGASVLVLVGMFASRLEFVMGGQVVALTNDPGHQFPIAAYAPSAVELAIVVMGVALFALLYTVARGLFDLDAVPGHETEMTTEPDAVAKPEGSDDD